MRLKLGVKGISKSILILLLVISFISGVLLSYVYTMGFYSPLEFKLPEKSVIAIENVEFSAQDTSFFNVTVLNPSYSPSDVKITRIVARTTDDNKIHEITQSSPPLPHLLKRGISQTFMCSWNWANYTGIKLPYTDRPVEVFVFLEDGTGTVLEVKKPLVKLFISELEFNSTISVNHFNITIENLQPSVTYVNITSISVDVANITSDMVTPNLPYGLAPGDPPAKFKVMWNWTEYQGETITVGAHTKQGYIHMRALTLPPPVNLTITDVAFNTSDTTRFNVTITNAETSPTHVDIRDVSVSIDNMPVNLIEWVPLPSTRLDPNTSVVLVCTLTLNWSDYPGQNLTVKVVTTQGFVASKSTEIPQI